MSTRPGIEKIKYRDGTSQSQRPSPALNPAYVSVDERSLRDLLAFARKYAEQLLFVEAETHRKGNWSAFLAGDPDDMIAYLQNPEIFEEEPEKKALYARPHLVLFLTFLKLLQPVRAQMNQLTQRHLEFYYETALKLTKKSAIPDLVHVIPELLPQSSETLIPAGTTLSAGPDSTGIEQIYKTEEDLVVNHGQVSQIMSLHVKKKRTGLAQIYTEQRSQPDGGFMDMLKMVYGDNGLATNSLAPFEYSSGLEVASDSGGPAPQNNLPMDYNLIQGIDQVFFHITGIYHMRISAFRRAVKLYKNWQEKTTWNKINTYLQAAFRKRTQATTGPTEFEQNTFDLHDFDTNFVTAIGFHPSSDANKFDGLAEVDSIYDLHRVLERLKKDLASLGQQSPPATDKNKEKRIAELEAFITGDAKDLQGNAIGLFFPQVNQFKQMISGRNQRLSYLRAILDILRVVVRNEPNLVFDKNYDEYFYRPATHMLQFYLENIVAYHAPVNSDEDPSYSTISPRESIGPFMISGGAWPENFDEILESTQKYFKMRLADYHFIRKVFLAEHPHSGLGSATPVPQADWKWKKVGEVFKAAFTPKKQTELEDVQWENLYFAKDAKSVSVPHLTGAGLTRWKTFARSGTEPSLTFGRLGFAIASPMLLLTEGKRKIMLTMGFAEKGFKEKLSQLQAVLTGQMNASDFPLRFSLSTAKEMIPLKAIYSEIKVQSTPASAGLSIQNDPDFQHSPTSYTYANTIQFVFEISPEIPPISALDGSDSISKWPCLTVELADLPQRKKDAHIGHEKAYDIFRELQLTHIHLAAHVSEIQSLSIQNDEGEPDPKKPFDAFGANPRSGNSLYLTHADLARQRLDRVVIGLDWMNLPEMGLGDYYKAYRDLAPESNFTIPIHANEDFRVNLSLQDGNHEQSLAKALKLFPVKGSASNTLNFSFTPDSFSPQLPYRRMSQLVDADEVLDWERYFKLELRGPDFQQEKYPSLIERQSQLLVNGKSFATGSEESINRQAGDNTYTLQQIPVAGLTLHHFEVSTTEAGKSIQVIDYIEKERKLSLRGNATQVKLNYRHHPNPNPYQDLILHPPFVPILKSLRVKYTTHMELALNTGRDQKEDQLIQLMPAGHNPMELLSNKAPAASVPPEQKAPETGYYLFPHFEEEGELYIGLKGLEPPQSINLLFQLAEGSNNPALKAAKVSWHYLSGTDWKSLEQGQMLSDTTSGLLTSGIIRFAIPEDAKLPHTLLPPECIWIRARVNKDADSIADTVAIHSQAIQAIFVDQSNAATHYQQSLASKSIDNFQIPLPDIAGVLQPYPSFKGKAAEEKLSFYTRVSERLRHKQRAISAWDYERLILEKFPEIHKVRVLHADHQEDPNHIGRVDIVLIPNIRGKQLYDPYEPRVSQDLLKEVKTFVCRYASPFVDIQVKNPTYYYLVIKLEVRFRDMSNPGYYLDLLNREIRQFLSPWLFDASSEILFGGEIYDSVIVNFLENRSYIDFVEYPQIIVQRRDANQKAETLGAPYLSIEKDSGHISILQPDVVLVSDPQHRLSLIPPDSVSSTFSIGGIGELEVELDFSVDTKKSSS